MFLKNGSFWTILWSKGTLIMYMIFIKLSNFFQKLRRKMKKSHFFENYRLALQILKKVTNFQKNWQKSSKLTHFWASWAQKTLIFCTKNSPYWVGLDHQKTRSSETGVREIFSPNYSFLSRFRPKKHFFLPKMRHKKKMIFIRF